MQAGVGKRWRVLIAVGLFVIVADQFTKYLAVRHLTPGIAKAKLGTVETIPKDKVLEALADVSHLEGLYYFYTTSDPCKKYGEYCPTVAVVDGFWNFKYVQNPGAAWGLLAGADRWIRVPFFLFVSFAAIIFIILFYRRLTDDQHLMAWALALVFGGAVGNLLDRLHLSYVVDFIDWYVGTAHWPTFNVADAGISTGVALLMLEWLRDALQARTASDPQSS